MSLLVVSSTFIYLYLVKARLERALATCATDDARMTRQF